ncbi:pantoate--beta-alanine ligase [Metabacillus sp. RGM 3146]|uniref:pantoate--beta-alanine ligase n=1 Tax=Metabacillus sp. RGM 3146 TaxID=3401092 RepID=UPI003B99540C
MKKIEKITELRQIISQVKKEGKTIGLVPTMGFLHNGHLELLKHARKDNEIVVMSIFVNPLQFGPNEDFEAYPRNMEKDLLLAEQEGADFVFAPDVSEMYQGEPSVTIKVTKRVDVLCGKSRPGHFDGVATVLTKLFNLVQPEKVYFGMKDAQQVAVVRGLVDDFQFPIEIVPVQTVRENDGLAKSSRNVYLSERERQEAPVLHKALLKGKALIEQGERDLHTIKKTVEETITAGTNAEIDYLEIYQYPELTEPKNWSGEIIIAAAVKFTKARLIDNITLEL